MEEKQMTVRFLKKDDKGAITVEKKELIFKDYLLDAQQYDDLYEKSKAENYMQMRMQAKSSGNDDVKEKTSDNDFDIGSWGKARRNAIKQATIIMWGLQGRSLKEIVAADFQKLFEHVEKIDPFKFEEQKEKAKKKLETMQKHSNTSQENTTN
jgi:hypothetical protein